MLNKQLTKKQAEVFNYVKSFREKKNYSPALSNIAKHFDVSIPTIHQHIDYLKRKGHLKNKRGVKHSIQTTENTLDTFLQIPILGTIAAGEPIATFEIPDGFVSVEKKEIVASKKYYALRVVGDSMVNDGIFEGDTVVIREEKTADNGQMVVAIIDDEQATLKRIYREKNRIRLQPANQNILPFYRKDVEVRGVVVKIIRNITEEKEGSFAFRKKEFLNRIKSTSGTTKQKYKRVALSPIRYAGGKSLAVGHVIELIPDNVKKLVSPFFGGGSIEIAASKELGLEVVGYDIFDILCNYWKFQIENPKLLYDELRKMKPEKEYFEKIRKILTQVWKGKIKLDPLTLAVYYVYNFNLSYGPGFMGWSSDIYLNKEKYKRMIERIRDFSPGNLKVKCDDFRNIMRKHENDFLYLDPPYYLGEDSKMFKGIYPMRNIPVHHNGFPHEALRDLLKNHKGGFILSYNNCPTIREYYKEYKHYFPTWQYTMGQGETRIGKNRTEKGDDHIKESHEIIIYCPPKK